MIWSGFLIGLMGSLHCVGMCGPLAFAVPTVRGHRLASALIYNGGRIITYAILGVIVGLLGLGIHLAGFQSYLSILTGVFIILLVVFPALENLLFRLTKIDLGNRVRRLMSKHLKKHSYKSTALIGVLNGLLPCGLIYAALAGAIETGFVETAAVYMMLFGLGTSVLMIATMLSKGVVFRVGWFKPKKVVPYLTLVLGLLFVVRGLLYMRPPDAPETAMIQVLQTITMCHVD
jgi:sulfite exporter TauE/SafE